MKILILVLVLEFLIAQDFNQNTPNYKISSEKFFADKSGNIKIFVNVWGHVNNPGLHEVYDGIDLATLMSIVGGPRAGANLKKCRLYREIADSSGDIIYNIDYEKFYRSGDRSNFIKVKPNDTIIIPQKFSDYIIRQSGTVNTVLSMLNLYFQILRAK